MGSHSLLQGIVPAQGEIEVERTLQFIKNLLSFASTDSSFSLISHHLVPIPFPDLPVQLPKCPASHLSEHLCDMPLAILALLDPTSSLRLCLSITFSGRLSPFFFNNFIYLFIGCTGHSLLCGLFSSCGEWGLLSTCGARLPYEVASPAAERFRASWLQ